MRDVYCLFVFLTHELRGFTLSLLDYLFDRRKTNTWKRSCVKTDQCVAQLSFAGTRTLKTASLRFCMCSTCFSRFKYRKCRGGCRLQDEGTTSLEIPERRAELEKRWREKITVVQTGRVDPSEATAQKSAVLGSKLLHRTLQLPGLWWSTKPPTKAKCGIL